MCLPRSLHPFFGSPYLGFSNVPSRGKGLKVAGACREGRLVRAVSLPHPGPTLQHPSTPRPEKGWAVVVGFSGPALSLAFPTQVLDVTSVSPSLLTPGRWPCPGLPHLVKLAFLSHLTYNQWSHGWGITAYRAFSCPSSSLVLTPFYRGGNLGS